MVNGPQDCKEVFEIFNPNTKRCIAIVGGPGKKLVKLFMTSAIKLPEEEIKKIIKALKWTETYINTKIQGENKDIALNCLKNNCLKNDTVKKIVKTIKTPQEQPKNPESVKEKPESVKPKTPQEQPEKKETVQEKPVISQIVQPTPQTIQKPCLSNTIWNPNTKRCVAISGSVGKKLIGDIIAGLVKVSQEDINKILASPDVKQYVKFELMKLSTTHVNQPNQVISNKDIPEDVKNKVHKFVEEWKKKKDTQFMDEGHKKYCATRKINDLTTPIVSWTANVQLPIERIQSPIGSFLLKSLDQPKQKFTLQHIQGISLSFNNYSIRNILYKGVKDSFTYIENMVDSEWLNQMNNYVVNLSTKNIYTMIGYTFYGDTVANNYLRKNLNKQTFFTDISSYDKWWVRYFPLFFQTMDELRTFKGSTTSLLKDNKDVSVNILSITHEPINKNLLGSKKVTQVLDMLISDKTLKQSEQYVALYYIGRFLSFSNFWQHVIIKYIQDLDNIINNAPPLKTPLIVYRGVKNDYYLKGREGFVYTTNSFVSTSVNLGSALKFAGPTCCFKRITLLPGTRTLLLAGISSFLNEVEILLGTAAKFYITKEKRFISKNTTDMCPTTIKNRIMVTDAVVIKS